MRYQIKIKTGDAPNSGTNSDIQLKIIGSKGETKYCTLDHYLHDDFQHGATDTYNVIGADVGDIECLSIYAKPMVIDVMTCSWYIDYIVIVQDPPNGTVTSFPVYHWISKADHNREMIIATNKTCLPQNDSPARLQHGRRKQQVRKDTIKWQVEVTNSKGLPRSIEVNGGHDDITDLNVRFTDNKNRNFTNNAMKALNNAMRKRIYTKIQRFETFDDFRQLSKGLKDSDMPPWVVKDTWRTDEEFGRQMINGTNPTFVKRCRSLPQNFPVTNAHVNGLLSRGKTLEQEMEDGRIYIVNYKILENVTTGEHNGKKIQLASPMCLFYVTEKDQFVPIAIQLGQNPGYDFPIWSPKDEALDWLLAKLWFKNADAQVMQLTTHLAYTHLLIEPFAIAFFRCLPPPHPIHKLLREFLQFVIAINVVGRDKLLCPV
jgi:arachidonate 5-lipoxygenase